MRDMHCHILPGVDDGARTMDESLAMLEAARAAGVTSIVCTPHVRDPYFDYDAQHAAFAALVPRATALGMGMTLGFEVAHDKLRELGVEEWAPRLAFDGTGEFLLELDTGCTEVSFREYERTIFVLQGLGLDVVIAHPERYRALQQNERLAERLVRLGCRLQASADVVVRGRLSGERRLARRLFRRGLYDFVASDAHRPEHYRYLPCALREYALRRT